MPGNELPAVNWQKFSAKRFAPAANIRQFASHSADFPHPGPAKCGSRAQFVGVISSLISRHLPAERVRAPRDRARAFPNYVRIAVNDVVNGWLKSRSIHFPTRRRVGILGPFTGRGAPPFTMLGHGNVSAARNESDNRPIIQPESRRRCSGYTTVAQKPYRARQLVGGDLYFVPINVVWDSGRRD